MRRHIRALLVQQNQRRILRKSQDGQKIALHPVNCVEHYYHFLFDLCLPLYQLTRRNCVPAIFILESFGPFSDRINSLFPGQTCVLTPDCDCQATMKMPLRGMNPLHVHLRRCDLFAFAEHAIAMHGVTPQETPTKVVLVERLPPAEYFCSQAVKKGGGTSRRSIVNHDEVKNALEDAVKPPYEFVNARLETMTFQDQIHCFRDAQVVFAQHGAALANSIWMRPGSHVVEFSNAPELKHFKMLSDIMGLNYHLQRTESKHARINVCELLAWLESSPHFKSVFI